MVTAISPQVSPAGRGRAGRVPAPMPAAEVFLRAQSLNAARHAASLRPFHHDEFGTGAASPSDAHIRAANRLLDGLRQPLLALASQVRLAATDAGRQQDTEAVQALLHTKDRAGQLVKHVE